MYHLLSQGIMLLSLVTGGDSQKTDAKVHQEDQQSANIAAAFQALEQKDYKTLIRLQTKHKVPLHAKHSNRLSLLEHTLNTCDISALTALVEELELSVDAHTLSNIRTAIHYPEVVINHVATRYKLIQDFKNKSPYTLHEEFISTPPLNRNEMLCISLGDFILNSKPRQEVLDSFIALGIHDYINRPLPDGSCDNLHEKLWLYDPFRGKKERSRKNKELITSFLFPYFSSRAFEHIDYLYDSKDLKDEESANYFHAKHAEWKAMSAQRKVLVKQCVRPCEGIVQDYLEDDEANQIRDSLTSVLLNSYDDVDKGYRSLLPPEIAGSNADLIMQYTGIYGKCD
jgi:hypothetical protein